MKPNPKLSRAGSSCKHNYWKGCPHCVLDQIIKEIKAKERKNIKQPAESIGR